VAQVAGGVPAMCDGVTQGQDGMELSLFSRDVIAMAAAVGLSHDMFDAAVYLGVCDKIVPGLLIAALTFGHLPAVFIPAGPMTSGLPNDEKAKIRQLYAEGKVGRDGIAGGGKRLLSRAGHLHLLRHGELQPDADGDHGPAHARRASFVNPNTPLRDALTRRRREARARHHRARQRVHAGGRDDRRALHRQRRRRAACHGRLDQPHDAPDRHGAAAGIKLTWQDISDLSDAVPLLARVYPNGSGRREPFPRRRRAGLHDRRTLGGAAAPRTCARCSARGFRPYAVEARLDENGAVVREPVAGEISGDPKVLATDRSMSRSSPMAG
jgi:phosphogluconate dehydratase